MFRVLLLITILSAFYGKIEGANLELPENSKCQSADGRQGVCVLDCEYTRQLSQTDRTSEIDYCGFKENLLIVCCPFEKPNDSTTIRTTSTTRASRRPMMIDPGVRISGRKSKLYCDIIKSQPVNEILVEIDPQIRNGTPASKREFPFMVALVYNSTVNGISEIVYNCGGALLSRTFVLTAGHCLKRFLTKVRVGSVFVSANPPIGELPQEINIKNKIIHEDYNKDRKYDDIALLELSKPVDITDGFVRPICLPTIGSKSVDNKYGIAGWGEIKPSLKSERLFKANITQYPQDECRDQFVKAALFSQGTFTENLIDSQFCAKNNETNANTCGGDSGGPAFFKTDKVFYVYGITSFGLPGACSPTGTAPGIYTLVEYYLDWIEQKIWPDGGLIDDYNNM